MFGVCAAGSKAYSIMVQHTDALAQCCYWQNFAELCANQMSIKTQLFILPQTEYAMLYNTVYEVIQFQ